MTSSSLVHKIAVGAAVLLGFGAASPVAGAPVWFDETGGGGFTGFSELASEYGDYRADPAGPIIFNHLDTTAPLGELPIGRGKMPRSSRRDFANGPLVDNVTFQAGSVPEPATNVLVLFSAGLFVLRWPSLRGSARA